MSSSTSDYEQLQAGQDEEEVDAMEFRLFASQDTPTAIVLAQTQPELVYVHRERPDLEESPGSVRMKQIADAAIDSATIMEQAKIPWTRTFFAHKVIDVPSKQRTCSGTTKKSKRKREWEKKVKAGLIDQATIDATARQVKVSESWGKPFLVRKGLDRNTIDTGVKQTTSGSSARGGRGGRGGAQRGRGASRGSRGGREGARGGLKSGTHMSRRGDRQDKAVNKSDGDDKSELSASTVPLKRSVNEHGVKDASKKRKVSDSSTAKQTSGNSSMSTSSGSKDKAMISGDRSSSTKITPQDSTSSSTPSKEKKATLPPKKPKASKPQSKLDNIMAILTGK
ncbi:hypothetical protein BGZ51_005841 [Haplosporangium sp. Z 767]|nr:hypothetical protein BGZ51_005841 [Haplosporangium sp. Z 767]KAF9194591.1 hypothetical protein BGZ50_006104 [Haplosporangium sp. Z 11]